MTIAQEKSYYTPEEYLELEVNSLERHEYIDGRIIIMPGGTTNHSQITLNLGGTLNFLLKLQPYRVFTTDQRLWIPNKRIYTYPDIIILKSPLTYHENRKDIVTNPLVIVEVLSKSTQNYDRDDKFAAYRTIPSFQEYILIDQYKIHIEQFSKTDNNKWLFSDYNDISDTLNLIAVPVSVSLADIYDQVDFEEE
ncbi:MAG TPA: Uma2 family endonuclease [Nostocaceae cyanobacterium]|nr:Uma2 family endonuclease [Nostocaceae cyanobacterium]